MSGRLTTLVLLCIRCIPILAQVFTPAPTDPSLVTCGDTPVSITGDYNDEILTIPVYLVTKGDMTIDATASTMTNNGIDVSDMIGIEIMYPDGNTLVTDGDNPPGGDGDAYPDDYLILGIENVPNGTYELYFFAGPGFPPPRNSTGTFDITFTCATNAPTTEPTGPPTTTPAPTQPSAVGTGTSISGDYNGEDIVFTVMATSTCAATFDASGSTLAGITMDITDSSGGAVASGGDTVTVSSLPAGNYTVSLSSTDSDGTFSFSFLCSSDSSSDSDSEDSEDTNSGDSDTDSSGTGTDSDGTTDSDDTSTDTDSDDDTTSSDNNSDTESGNSHSSDTITTSESPNSLLSCVALSYSQEACESAHAADGTVYCVMNMITSTCYAVVSASGQYGRGSYDQGYTTATAELMSSNQQMKAVVGVLATIVVLLFALMMGGGYFIWRKTTEMEKVADESIATSVMTITTNGRETHAQTNDELQPGYGHQAMPSYVFNEYDVDVE